jgi:hypothetical protein
MDFAWWDVFSKAAARAGFGPLTTLLMGLGIVVLIYLGNILKGIKSGYSVVLQDQKDATTALRDQLRMERENNRDLYEQVDQLRQYQVRLLSALSTAEKYIIAHGIEVPSDIEVTLDESRVIEHDPNHAGEVPDAAAA